MQKILLITFFLLSSLFADIGLGTIVGNNSGAFSFSSNLTFSPKKPSSGESVDQIRTIHFTLLTTSGLEFLHGKSAHFKKPSYLGLNYYLPIEDYTLSFNFKKRYENYISDTGVFSSVSPKEYGATLSWKVSNKVMIPYLKYTLVSYKYPLASSEINSNYELLTFGGYVPYQNFILSFNYTLPFNGFNNYYNSKGTINIIAGLYLD